MHIQAAMATTINIETLQGQNKSPFNLSASDAPIAIRHGLHHRTYTHRHIHTITVTDFAFI